MYFQIQEDIVPIEIEKIDPDKLTFGIISLEELEHSYQQFGFSTSTVMDCRNNIQQIHSTIDIYDTYYFGIILGIDTRHIINVQDRIGFYIKNNLFLLVIIEDRDDSTRVNLFDSLKHLNLSKISLERLIYGFFERLISADYIALEKIEVELSKHEDMLNERQINKDLNNQITKLRKRLLVLDNYYEQLITIGEELEENENDLFKEENLRFFKMFTNRVTRLSNNTRMLQDYSIHVREAYHAQLEYSLNRIMKLFTVVTTIFLPLTLIVGWYGMNFTTMPELTWKYGYVFVITISVIVAVFCILYFKKKKFF